MEQTPIIFHEICPDVTVRVTLIGTLHYLSIRDMIMSVCDASAKLANQKWNNLSDDVKNDLEEYIRTFKFSGQGQLPQSVISFKGALKLVMFLGGKKASKYRSDMFSVLERYYAGDESLKEGIDANARSDGILQQMARESLGIDKNAITVTDHRHLGKRQHMEETILELEVQERQQRLMRMHVETQKMHIENQHKRFETYTQMCGESGVDERARLQFKDTILNAMIPMGNERMIGDNGDNTPITISTVATEMGYFFDGTQLQKIGMLVSKAYREKYNEAPSKHKQSCGQAIRYVCSYTERDRALVETQIKKFSDDNDLRVHM